MPLRNLIQRMLREKSIAKPVEFSRDGSVAVSTETHRRLIHLETLGFQLRERQEAAAAELCYLLGVDPDEDSIAADWCKDVVYNGVPLGIAIEHVARHTVEEVGR